MPHEHPRFHAETNDQYFCLLNPKEFDISLRFFDNGILRIVAKRVVETTETPQVTHTLGWERRGPLTGTSLVP